MRDSIQLMFRYFCINHWDKYIAILLTIMLLGFSYAQVWASYTKVPQGRYYYGQVVYPLDFLETLAVVENGRLGRWSGYLTFKENPNYISTLGFHYPDLIKYEYLIIGHVARIVGISSLLALYISKFLLTIGVFYTVWWFAGQILIGKFQRFFAYIVSLYYVPITIPSEPWNLWPTEVLGDAVQLFHRYTMVSNHYLIGFIGILISSIFLIRWMKSEKKNDAFIALLAGSVVSYVNFPPMILVYGSAIVISIVKYIQSARLKLSRKMCLSRSVVSMRFIFITMLPALLILPNLKRYFWDLQLVTYTQITWIQYGLTIGTLGLFAIFGAFIVIKYKMNDKGLFICSFVIFHIFTSLFVEDFSLFSAKRMFQSPYLVFYAILGMYGITSIVQFEYKKHKNAGYISLFLCIVAVFLPSIFTYRYAFRPESFGFTIPMDIGYPKKELMDAVFWLKDNTKPNDMIFTSYYSGTLVASFTGRLVPFSWWTRIVDPNIPIIKSLLYFYEEWLSSKQAKNILLAHSAKYVVYGEDERANNPNKNLTLSYPFLQEVFREGNTIIYAVK
jgi:hypothetical protein